MIHKAILKERIEANIKSAYRKGVIEGIHKYAHWKEGEQYVGTCGTTYNQAIKEADNEYIQRSIIKDDINNILKLWED